jgi:CRP/FNR family cyclic AMP-dependent transcriptional regulator
VAKTDPAVELLRPVPLFAGLTKSELAEVATITRPTTFDADDLVVTEGEKTGRFYIIVEGEAEVRVHGRPVNRLGPGNFFGEMSLLDDEPRSATVVAATPLRTLSIVSFNFRSLLKSNASITYKILLRVSERLRDVQQSVL